jgi:antitoxin PrlF
MVTATMTTKGQITIPKKVRDSLRLQSGDRVAFVLRDHTEVLMKPIKKSVDEIFGKLQSPNQSAQTVADMNAAVAGRFQRKRHDRG